MAKVYKCDRCGKFYGSLDTYPEDGSVRYTSRIVGWKFKGTKGFHLRKTLCPKCSVKHQKIMDGAEIVEKV